MQIFVKTPTGETVTIENEETGIQDRHSLKMKTVSEDLEVVRGDDHQEKENLPMLTDNVVFAIPRNKDEEFSLPQASTPLTNRRSSDFVSSANMMQYSPLIPVNFRSERSASIADPYTNLADMREAGFNHYTDRNGSIAESYTGILDNREAGFALNDLSICNDSGIDENALSFVGAIPKTSKKKIGARSLNKDLFNETPPGRFYDQDQDLCDIQLLEFDDEDKTTKRALDDSHIRAVEKSPSNLRMKRSSLPDRELDQDINLLGLPKVPSCFNESFNELSTSLVESLSLKKSCFQHIYTPTPADRSREYSLPYKKKCTEGHLYKCITPETLSELLEGKHDDKIDSYEIIDTRYPYEYDGGHIEGAVNIVTKDVMAERYFSPDKPRTTQVLFFHCEFSSKRGPAMCKYTREKDRDCNMKAYPNLYYPEVYILHGGYKHFYLTYPQHCSPCNYILMVDERFEDECNKWMRITKSITGNMDSNSNHLVKTTRTRTQRKINLA